jgi:hypothetical protein
MLKASPVYNVSVRLTPWPNLKKLKEALLLKFLKN